MNFELFCARVYSQKTYKELIAKIELYNKGFCFVMCISGSLVILTAIPYTIVRYYILNMGEESFYLFLPAWSILILLKMECTGV